MTVFPDRVGPHSAGRDDSLSDLPTVSFDKMDRTVAAFESAWSCWTDGPPPSVGDHLRNAGEIRDALLFELLKIDLEYRFAKGLKNPVKDYLASYPELGEAKAAKLSARDLLLRRQAREAATPVVKKKKSAAQASKGGARRSSKLELPLPKKYEAGSGSSAKGGWGRSGWSSTRASPNTTP